MSKLWILLYFCTFCTFVLCHLVRHSIWTSMQNLESVAQKMAELWVLLYLCTFVLFFVRKWLRAVKIYLHVKFQTWANLSLVMINFVFCPCLRSCDQVTCRAVRFAQAKNEWVFQSDMAKNEMSTNSWTVATQADHWSTIVRIESLGTTCEWKLEIVLPSNWEL